MATIERYAEGEQFDFAQTRDILGTICARTGLLLISIEVVPRFAGWHVRLEYVEPKSYFLKSCEAGGIRYNELKPYETRNHDLPGVEFDKAALT